MRPWLTWPFSCTTLYKDTERFQIPYTHWRNSMPRTSSNNKKVGVVMGSSSDLDTMREAVEVLKEFGLEFDVDVVSCHRAPQLAHEYAADAEKKGYAVIIAGAGGAAALPGVLASLTTVPVIGVPMVNQVLGGVDALYSMLQMPKGVPVAVAGLGKTGAQNAAILAVEILGLRDSGLKLRLAGEFKFIYCDNKECMWEAIKTLRVRGAPAIGIAAAMGTYLGIRDVSVNNFNDFFLKLKEVSSYLGTARPTAVNLFWALERMEHTAQAFRTEPLDTIKEFLFEEALEILGEDRDSSKKICD